MGWPILISFGSLIQLTPMFYLAYLISFTHSEVAPSFTSNRNRQQNGPSSGSKGLLIVYCISTMIFWMEPSIIYRFLDYIFGHPEGSRICIVPPFWWLVVDENEIQNQALGWASFIDLLLWFGGTGLIFVFYFMKREYTRNMNVTNG